MLLKIDKTYLFRVYSSRQKWKITANYTCWYFKCECIFIKRDLFRLDSSKTI